MKVTIIPTEQSSKKEVFSTIILVVDDQKIVFEAISHMLKDQKDITLHYCNDPSMAVSMALSLHPTLILLDLVMPDIDGITLLRYFRATSALKDVPLIVLSSKEDPFIKAESFANGANDYLVKLPDPVELTARIRYHSSAYIRLLERNSAYKSLKESQEILHHDLSGAAGYVKSLLPKKLTGEISTDWRFIPSAELGGDSFGYHWIDKDRFAFYLLDVCGHGVRAALLSISVMNVLRSQSLNADYKDPSKILNELNHNFPMEDHSDMFFTICYGVYDKKTSRVVISSGGHPPAILVRQTKGNEPIVKKLIAPGGSVLGAIYDMEFPTVSADLLPGDAIYIYSDGLYELQKNDGTMLQLDEFLNIFMHKEAMNEEGGSEIDRILNFSKQIMRGSPFIDDVALLQIVVNPKS